MIDVIARGMIEESNGDISQISEKVNNHTEDSDIHVTTTDKENWNSHPNDVTAGGNSVQLDNLQGGVPFSEMVVSGKNCIDTNTYITNANVTDNGDNISVEWTAAMYVRYTAVLSPNTDYILSWEQKADNGTDAVRANVINAETNETIKQQNSADVTSGTDYVKNYFAFNTGDCSNVIIQFIRATNTGNVYIKKTIQLEIGSTPTAYEPPITGRELTLAVSGKNLINNIQATGTVVGVTVTKNDDGTVTINGTTTGDLWLLFDDKCHVVKDKTYTFSMGFDASVGIMFGVRSGDNAQSYLSTGTSGSFVAPETGICRIRGYVKSGITFDNLTIYPQLELGSAVTEYEPYHGSTTTITPDTNPYVIPNDIRQVDGLNNISVSAGKLSVTGVRKNAALKRIWDKLDELTTAIIVSNGETTE